MYCDACHAEVVPKPVFLHDEDGDVEFEHYECPVCEKILTGYVSPD